MGFSSDEVDFLRSLEGLVDFRRTLTLGRQSLRLPRAALERRLHADVWGDGFGDGLLRHLGADLVDSLDASDFEGATVVHDLNLPAPTKLVGRYTAVIDAGTVEHVFNVPEALRTAMSLVAQGGHLVLMAPCNNNPGHGFYQFTPELVFRSLSASNGFAVVRCLLKEVRGRWYDVADPASLGRRREFRTRRSTYLFVVAERVSVVPIFAEWPQQSGLRVAVDRDEQFPRSTRHDAVAGPPWGDLAHRASSTGTHVPAELPAVPRSVQGGRLADRRGHRGRSPLARAVIVARRVRSTARHAGPRQFSSSGR